MTCLEYLKSLNPSITGVIQVGAHHGEEHQLWKDWGIENRAYFEPVPANFTVLSAKAPDAMLFQTALGNTSGTIEMFTEEVNGGQSCSILEPAKHKEILPWIEFNGKVTVPIYKLDDTGLDISLFNFLYIDAQGYDLEVLKGAQASFCCIDYIIAEVNRDEVYAGCAKLEEVQDYLSNYGYTMKHVEWHGGTFGDALFVYGD